MSTTGVALRDLLDQVNDATKLLQRSKTVPEQLIGLFDSIETALGAADPYLTATL